MKFILAVLLVLPVMANAGSQKVPDLALSLKPNMCDMLKFHLKPTKDAKVAINRRLPSGIKSTKNDSL